ncbi:MAG: CoA transferase [Deltaproteobacteria bacterium]|nr:CoA transferase [Deltaproteobacteria bacterium]
MRSLEGIRVLDLSRLLPGPFLTMALADLGADVIKIEAPGAGDYLRVMPPMHGEMSARFQAINRGKRSVALDLKQPAGRDGFLRMVEKCDVVVESFRPGVLARLGIGYQTLKERNSQIILCSISGYGQTGPYSGRAGHDLNYIGTAGVLAMGGPRGQAPLVPGVQIADLAGGALWGLSGVLAALVGRERGSGGTHLDIAMSEGAMALLATEIGNLSAEQEAPTRGTGTLNGGLACYRVYRTKDERHLSVGPLEPKFWMAFNKAIGRDGNMAEVMLGPDEQDRIADELQAILATKTLAEWQPIFDAADCCVDAVLELDELADHPQHRARKVFVDTETAAGSFRQMRLPIGEPAAGPSPKHGEHTREVLAELGFSAEDIDGLPR